MEDTSHPVAPWSVLQARTSDLPVVTQPKTRHILSEGGSVLPMRIMASLVLLHLVAVSAVAESYFVNVALQYRVEEKDNGLKSKFEIK